MNFWRLFLVLFVLFSSALLRADFLPPGCRYNKECIIELPGSFCGDGTQSYYTVLPKKNTDSIVVFLEPGGACWSKDTCNKSHVMRLTRREHKTKWGKKKGIFNLKDSHNPLTGFSIVSIPYCTGDVFIGNNEINYGTESKPHVIKHHGYKNVLLTLDAIKSLHPNPDKVVLFGMSAGGMGVLAHLRNIDSFFPEAEKFALADAGTPFLPPHLFDAAYAEVMNNWNAQSSLPEVDSPGSMRHLGDLVHYNTVNFPHIRYGLIQSYGDLVMTFFATSVGSPDSFSAVKDTIIDVADNYLGTHSANARVFYIESREHLHLDQPLPMIQSAGTSITDWLHGMFSGDTTWNNVRPDLLKP